MHGYAIARWIFDGSGEVLQIEEGTLYLALHRLEDRGWIRAEWGLSENNRRASSTGSRRRGAGSSRRR
ncbi:MAG: helix-turn-helix transcriptional regulator [Longimicrobiales bacterium]